MKNTGAWYGRYPVMAQRSTQRTDPSQPPDYRTYSPEVTSFEQSPGSSQYSPGAVLPSTRALLS